MQIFDYEIKKIYLASLCSNDSFIICKAFISNQTLRNMSHSYLSVRSSDYILEKYLDRKKRESRFAEVKEENVAYF